MQPGPQIDPAIRELARRMAWTADFAGVNVDTPPADLIAALHSQGYYLEHDPFQLLQSVGYAYNFRQIAAGIAEGNEAMTIGQLQQQYDMPVEFGHVHFRFGVGRETAGGIKYDDVVQVSVRVEPDDTVGDVIQRAVDQARYNAARTSNERMIGEDTIIYVSPVA